MNPVVAMRAAKPTDLSMPTSERPVATSGSAAEGTVGVEQGLGLGREVGLAVG